MDEVVDWFSNLTSASLYDQRSDGQRKWCFVGKLMQQYGYELLAKNSQNSIRLESMLLHLLVDFDLDMASAAYEVQEDKKVVSPGSFRALCCLTYITRSTQCRWFTCWVPY